MKTPSTLFDEIFPDFRFIFTPGKKGCGERMRYHAKIVILTALTLLLAVVTGTSPQYDAFISHSLCAVGARSPAFASTDRHHHEKAAQLNNQFRWRVQSSRPTFRFGASEKIQNDVSATIPKITKKRRRSWEESYALLRAYKEMNGHCNVPQSTKPLGPWVNRQRIEHARYILLHNKKEITENNNGDGDDGISLPRSTSMTSQRKKLLDDIGFVWDAMGHTWNTRYQEL